MKKIIYLMFLAIGMTGCSVESIDSTEGLVTADARFNSQSTVTITAPAGDLCVGEVLTFSVEVNSSSNFQVQQLIEGEWEQVYLASQGLSGTDTFEVILAEGDNFFRHTNQGTGPNWKDYPTSFVGVVCDTCENSLEVDVVCGDTTTASFTFTAEEAGDVVIQGGLTNGTEILVAYSNILERNITHPGVKNSNANVTRWEGYVEACEEVTIFIEFEGGDGIGDWTAKRGEDDNEELLGFTDAFGCN